jgi:prepilin-type N-terminal cleavage/methylation domain-containing protein
LDIKNKGNRLNIIGLKKKLLLNSQRGFSLIEVMVASAILSFSLLGYAQAQSMRQESIAKAMRVEEPTIGVR